MKRLSGKINHHCEYAIKTFGKLETCVGLFSNSNRKLITSNNYASKLFHSDLRRLNKLTSSESSSERKNPLVFTHNNSLRHLSDEEKDRIISDMQINWREHFPTPGCYTRKMRQMYDISTLTEFRKAKRILDIEERHLRDYKSYNIINRVAMFTAIFGIIGAYYYIYSKENKELDEFYKNNEGLVDLSAERFELTDEQAEERLILIDKKKEEQRGGQVDTKKLRDKFDRSQLGLAKLFAPAQDFHQILQDQQAYEKEKKLKEENGEIPKYKFTR